MNYAIVFRLLGYVLMIEGALLLLPAAASLVYGEWMVLGVFLLTAAVSAGIGYALHTIKPRSKVFYMREGFAATSLCWVFISVMGAVPFVLTGCIPNPVDALFETVSGFTTTGASILPAVEGLPNGILFWRSFTHWIGGMGVLVFLLSLLPLTGGSHVNLMKAESPGPQVDKLVPKVQSTAKILYGIYFALTVLELVFLLIGRMPLFEAMLTAFGTAGTGGFWLPQRQFCQLFALYPVGRDHLHDSVRRQLQRLLPAAHAQVPPRCRQRGGAGLLLWSSQWQWVSSLPIFIVCTTALARRCGRPLFRWAPSSPPPAFPAAILTCGRPSRKRFWSCSCSLAPAPAVPAAASR